VVWRQQLGNERIGRSVLLNHGFVRRCQISWRKFPLQTRVNGLVFVRFMQGQSNLVIAQYCTGGVLTVARWAARVSRKTLR
jgi:hypothetical protein